MNIVFIWLKKKIATVKLLIKKKQNGTQNKPNGNQSFLLKTIMCTDFFMTIKVLYTSGRYLIYFVIIFDLKSICKCPCW